MVNRIILERILADIKTNVKELRDAKDVTWLLYRTDVRVRRFVERTLGATQKLIHIFGWTNGVVPNWPFGVML